MMSSLSLKNSTGIIWLACIVVTVQFISQLPDLPEKQDFRFLGRIVMPDLPIDELLVV